MPAEVSSIDRVGAIALMESVYGLMAFAQIPIAGWLTIALSEIPLNELKLIPPIAIAVALLAAFPIHYLSLQRKNGCGDSLMTGLFLAFKDKHKNDTGGLLLLLGKSSLTSTVKGQLINFPNAVAMGSVAASAFLPSINKYGDLSQRVLCSSFLASTGLGFLGSLAIDGAVLLGAGEPLARGISKTKHFAMDSAIDTGCAIYQYHQPMIEYLSNIGLQVY